MKHRVSCAYGAALVGIAALLAACVAPTTRRTDLVAPARPSPIVIYAARGQDSMLIERDRYECHGWAVKQRGYDPSRRPPAERVTVESAAEPGTGIAVGAVAGALLGAVIGGPRSAGAGLVIGGVTGAAIGAASDATARSNAAAEQKQADQDVQRSADAAEGYRRALSACLEGRGYTVR